MLFRSGFRERKDAAAEPVRTGRTAVQRGKQRNYLGKEHPAGLAERGFLQAAFTAEEQAAIATANLSNGKAQGHWTTNGGKDTEDQVFLLSCAEAQKYLGVSYKNTKNEKPRTSPTDYAIAQGAGTSAVMTDEERPVGIWWLRSPGLNKESAALVQDGGSLYYRGVTDASVMVRPAILLDLTSDSF